MSDVLNKLKRLRGLSRDEARVRLAQKLAILAERNGLSRQTRLMSDAELLNFFGAHFTSADELLARFRTTQKDAPRFFPAFADAAHTGEALRARFAANASPLVARAERIIARRFDLLGLRELSFGDDANGDNIDWRFEPRARHRTAPQAHWSRIAYLDPSVAGDKKITWELNRHAYFAVLGRAYLHTGDERYAACFAAHVASWMDANPPKRGINWASSLEVAFRSIAWFWAIHFFRDSAHLTPALFARIYKHLYANARHLETFLSTYFSPNTHLTGEALGLYYTGTLLPECKDAARWRATGRETFLRALARHIRPDGTYFEQSSYYARYTADFCLHLRTLSARNDDALGAEFDLRLTNLLDHLMHLTRPDGRSPRFGDDDGGRLLALDDAPFDDFRTTLAVGAGVFNRADYKFVAMLDGEEGGEGKRASEEVFWLLGAEGLARFDALDAEAPRVTARAFDDGGFYVVRDAWSADANYLLFDCGAHGADNGGHAHADALAFEFAVRGRAALVDPGTYTYTGDRAARDWFRSSQAHNTLTVDDASSSLAAGVFTWRTQAECKLSKWIDAPRFAFAEGVHDGYRCLEPPVEHRRAALFLRGDYVILRDRVATHGAHAYALRFHFAPELSARIEGDGKGGGAFVRAFAATCATQEPDEAQSADDVLDLHTFAARDGAAWRICREWFSPAYAARVEAFVASFEVTARGAQEFVTLLFPAEADKGARKIVREAAARGGRLFRVERATMDDRQAGMSVEADAVFVGVDVETNVGGSVEDEHFDESVACDADLAWWRVRGELKEVVLIGGRHFALDGVAMFEARAPVAHVAIEWRESAIVVEAQGAGEWRVRVQGRERIIVGGQSFDTSGQEFFLYREEARAREKPDAAPEGLEQIS